MQCSNHVRGLRNLKMPPHAQHSTAGCSTYEILKGERKGKKKKELELLKRVVAFPSYVFCGRELNVVRAGREVKCNHEDSR